MATLDQLLSQTEELATSCGMHAKVVWLKSRGHPDQGLDGLLSDGGLFIISPIDVPDISILEVERQDHLRIYKHRNSELSNDYWGHRITVDWVKKFIIANAAFAADIRINKLKSDAALDMQKYHEEIASLNAKIAKYNGWLNACHKTIYELEGRLAINRQRDPNHIYATSGGNDWREQK